MQSSWKTLSSVSITFANGQAAQVIQVHQQEDIPTALQILGLQSRPTLVLIGGASHISPTDFNLIQHLLITVIAPLAESIGAIVVDGGTNAGVMQLMGQARSALSAQFPLIGVSPIQLVHLADQQPAGLNPTGGTVSPVCLEPHHTHFMLVPGCEWGDESSWLAQIASAVAGSHPSIAVLVNGGKVSLMDVQWNIAERRPIAIVAGSGRLADEIAVAMRHPEAEMREAIKSVVQSGYLNLLEVSAPAHEIENFLRLHIAGERSSLTPLTQI